ncbi:NACHT domain-containing protein [Streptomyces sp. MB09-02B]|uniref:NACHT domain-containing protein n=1 Tax=Streptomyces sp. MB09-02B TaxID=3028667 RepID=UPI0029A41220|nr:NACHT domain-containing protein [Streptomyces sp. MB09-02B]MDX3644345.1 NACHT domain-containing protein [Streptomyces sp. MB09-02B]
MGGAALLVTVGVATNQVLNDGKLSLTWMYAAFGVAVLSLLFSERAVPAPADDTPRGGRRVYLRQLRASVQDMETVGIATQSEFVFRMRQVYVDVSVVPKVLHDAAREPFLGSVSGEERRSLESVLRNAGRDGGSRVLAVIGGPGSGKTTLARNTALGLCRHRRRPWKQRLPVLLYLRRHAADLLADEPPSLGAAAVKAAWLDGKVPAHWLDQRLDRGGCVILLDGLDEVADPAERGRVVDWVDRQIQSYPHNTYVVTSRPHGYRSNPVPGAEVLQVRRFTWAQIDQFLRQWSYATESRARGRADREVRAAADRNAADLLARLQEQGALYDLAANPLLLTMTANVHRYRGQLPGSRAELYDEMCDVLLHRRSEARGLSDATGLTGPHKQHVAQHLALAMMKAQVKDWPERDAARAIRRPLRQVPGDVPPKVFLEVACASGLLVEREHGVYGFAHLTLQEYLAATQLGTPRADTSVLIDNVEDPWWRETILLWSAANDATDIITACLGRGTLPALALAFDCADQARTVEPETRDRLEELLGPPPPDTPHDPARQRLLAGVQATRALRETIRLHNAAALCSWPVPYHLYQLFVQDERAAGRLHHPYRLDTLGNDGSAVVGMQVGDAERFPDWLNAFMGGGVCRLPTLDELRDPAAASVAGLGGHTVWAHDGAHTVLHQTSGARWPYVADAERLHDIPVADRQQLDLSLRLLATPVSQRARVSAWTSVLIAALTHTAESPDVPPPDALALPSTLAVLTALHQVGSHASLIEDDPEHIHDLGRPVARARGFVRDLNVTQAMERALDPALVAPLSNAIAIADTLHDSLAQIRASGHDRRDHVEDLHFHVDQLRSLTSHLCLDVDRAFDLDLGPALGLTADRDPVGGDALGHVLGDPLELTRQAARGLTSLLEQGITDTTRVVALAMDLSRALSDPVQTDVLRLSVSAYRTLITCESAALSPQSLLGSLDYLLGQTGSEIHPGQRTLSDPATAVRHARELLRTADASGDRVSQVLLLTDQIVELLTSMRNRHTPTDRRTLACARTALLVAIRILRQAHIRDTAPIGLLDRAWLSLTTLDTRDARGSSPNQILVLVRTQP